MPRKRMISPEFWTSNQIVECSSNARLLFIGLWNFSDDAGRHLNSAKRLKMEIFPGDEVTIKDVQGWLDELTSEDSEASETPLVLAYETEGLSLLQVTGWKKWQKIDKPTIRYPGPLPEDSARTRQLLGEASAPIERKGKERKRKEETSCRALRFDEEDRQVAEWMFGKIRELNPDHKTPNLDKWASDIRLMRERDKRTHQQLREIFGWANADDFWKANVLSPAALRRHWEKLAIKRKPEPPEPKYRKFTDD